jgi:anti-anti-sigma regulatory factor
MDVRGTLDARSVAKAEETLANLESFRPMPLYINLSNLDDFDSKGFELFLQILFRFQDSYAYIKIIDLSDRYSATLRGLGVERLLDRVFLDGPNKLVSCTA